MLELDIHNGFKENLNWILSRLLFYVTSRFELFEVEFVSNIVNYHSKILILIAPAISSNPASINSAQVIFALNNSLNKLFPLRSLVH